MRRLIISLISKSIFFILLSIPMLGQNSDADLGSWSGFELKYKLDDHWKFSLEEQLRLKEDLATIDAFFTQLSAEFELSKKIELGAGLRFIRSNDNKGNIQGYESHVRFQFDTALKSSLKRFAFKQRLRYQHKTEVGANKPENIEPNQHLRFKSGVEYKIKNWRFDPKIAGEIYYQLGDSRVNEIDKMRLSIGTGFKVKKVGKFSVNYLFERELNSSNPFKNHIIDLKYTLEFRSLKNRG